MLFDVACNRVLGRLKLKNLKYFQRKILAQRNWQMVGMIFKFNQPQPWLLTANVKETTVKSIGNARSTQIQSVRVSADFYGKHKCDDEAKYNI